jgi:3',5'-cyclic AMP phosphodiesterase CpdA
MIIVQISDLHFGNHDVHLAEALKRRLHALKPDLIVVTGDLADEPKKRLFEQALEYLRQIEECCAEAPAIDKQRPRLICIPGNHDFLRRGFLPRAFHKVRVLTANYSSFFTTFHNNYFFQPENVWIFGFDSAKCQTAGGAGEIDKKELDRFHGEYDSLRKKHGPAFEEAFKIALVHHHPLPVDWGTNWKQRWLTMTNSGTFLAGVLHKKIDLILHGHEHLQAYARLRSSLGGKDESEATVISLGATLARENHGRNWFNVISIEADSAVNITSYPSFGQDFEEGGERLIVRSLQKARNASFDAWKRTSGFCYDEVTSATILDKDGDASRSVEYNGLRITDSKSARAREHVLELSYTSGYIDIPEVVAGEQCNLAGIYFVEPPPNRAVPHRSLKRTIRWGGRALQAGECVSYSCSWFAVNGFAMDQQQFEGKYLDASGMEFTHLPVDDPIEELLIVVQFPDNFKLLMAPEVRVSKYDATDARSWVRNDLAEHELRQLGALRYVQAIRIAALRVRRPLKGYSYGIQWRVPASAPRAGGLEAAEIRGIVTALLRPTGSEVSRDRFFLALLGRISIIARETFRMEDWPNALETTFMVFDSAERKLRIVGVSVTQLDNSKLCVSHPEPPNPHSIAFDYGDGIAGRAFKTNECRLYVDLGEKRKEPDYYRQIAGQSPHAVLLSMPVRNPKDEGHAYGVLNFASVDPGCPLRGFAFSNWPQPGGNLGTVKVGDTLAHFQKNINALFLESLSAEFVEGINH